MDNLKIGICIADTDEYEPVALFLESKGAKLDRFFGRMGHKLLIKNGDYDIEVYAICCGMGMVNAAAGTMYLVNLGCEVILNTGYSGGISKVMPGQVIIGTDFVEHDFDLTPIGYKQFEKPDQECFYKSDEQLSNAAEKAFPGSVKCAMVSGDRFISSDKDKEQFAEMFKQGVSCDMETAAVGYVCYLTGAKYLCVRIVSDTAGDSSANEYHNSLGSNKTDEFAVIIKKCIEIIAEVIR